MAPMTELSVADFDRVWAVNARGVFMGLRAVLKVMKPQGSGVIVNTASMAAIKGAATFSPYIASKHAVLGLTKSAALEGAPYGIRVNCVAPGHIDTRMARDLTAQINPDDPEGVFQNVSNSVPYGKRYGTAAEVANVVMWLLLRRGGVRLRRPAPHRRRAQRRRRACTRLTLVPLRAVPAVFWRPQLSSAAPCPPAVPWRCQAPGRGRRTRPGLAPGDQSAMPGRCAFTSSSWRSARDDAHEVVAGDLLGRDGIPRDHRLDDVVVLAGALGEAARQQAHVELVADILVPEPLQDAVGGAAARRSRGSWRASGR